MPLSQIFKVANMSFTAIRENFLIYSTVSPQVKIGRGT